MKKKEVALTLLFEGQKLELQSAFVGGWLADETDSPMGMYTGELDLEDTSIALMHMLRAVIKLYVDEHNLNYLQTKALLDFSVKEALEREIKQDPEDNKTVKQHQEKLFKIRRDRS
jgi:hypothetical protein